MPKKITIPAGELYDEATNTFYQIKEQTITIEHSLLSISKWEAKWKKPYLTNNPPKTFEEELDYIRCMTITSNVPYEAYYNLSPDNIKEIVEYEEDPMSATTINRIGPEKRGRKEIITSEVMYYYMIKAGIPFECEKWHFNRLMKLLEVYGVKENPKKMSRGEAIKHTKALNEARKAKHHTRG